MEVQQERPPRAKEVPAMADQQHGNQGHGNQGRGSNLSEDDRRRGGETSSNEHSRDSRGEFSGTGGSSGMGQGSSNMGGTSNMGGSAGMGRGQNEPRDDQ